MTSAVFTNVYSFLFQIETLGSTMKYTDSTLYSRCVKSISANLDKIVCDNLYDYMSNTSTFHVLWEVYLTPDREAEFKHWRLERELTKLDVFYRLLTVPGTRPEQHKMFNECNQPRKEDGRYFSLLFKQSN